MKLERKKILEKVGTSVIVSFIIFLFLSTIRLNGGGDYFLIFRSFVNPISIFIGFSCIFGIHIQEFFNDLILGIKNKKIWWIKYLWTL